MRLMLEQDSGAPMNLDDLLEGLRDVTERLDAASDNFGERVSLREQQRELQAIAAQLRQKARTSSQITRELDRLKRLRRRIDSSHLSVGHIGKETDPGRRNRASLRFRCQRRNR